MVDSTSHWLEESPTISKLRGLIATDKLAPWWDPRIWSSPDLGRGLRLVVTALAAWVTVCFILVWMYTLRRPLGDTDDAMRLVIVRDLVRGRAWYDQIINRIQPPAGAWLHWSRLLDGGLAGSITLLRPLVGAESAEWMTRDFWPLAWIFPAVLGALLIARNVGSRSAVVVTALLLIIDPQLFRQFTPGRIDHHNIQITMTVLAFAAAMATRNRVHWAIGCGLATSLGLAVGLEALAFHALVGGAYALELGRDRRSYRTTMAYGISLALGSLIFTAIQTPPWRWGLSFCDSLSLNLVAALVVGGLGLTGAAYVSRRLTDAARLFLILVVGATAAATYLGLAPKCIHGPFAEMSNSVRPFWFDHIQEIQPLPVMMRLARLSAIIAAVMMVSGLVAGGFLLVKEIRAPRTSVLLIAASLVVAVITAWFTWRMQDYTYWLGIPALGAAIGCVTDRWIKGRLAPALILAGLLSPAQVGTALGSVTASVSKPKPAPVSAGPRCFDPSAYGELAKMPPGVVLASPDLGPYILALTNQSVLAAPYHRLSSSILAAHNAFNADPRIAEAEIRKLKVDYVVDCSPYPMFLNQNSFGNEIRGKTIPSWLIRRSRPGASLTVFELRRPSR